MIPAARNLVRSGATFAAVLVLTGCGLTSCGGDTSTPGFKQTIKGEGGRESTVLVGPDAKVPKRFPSGVPLPEAGPLRAIVAERNPPNASFTMTYGLGGRNGAEVGNAYRDRLRRAGFRIDNYSSIGGSDGEMTQFDAIGKKWDVAVVSGKVNLRDRSTMSVLVFTHGKVTSGIGGIGNTDPEGPGSDVEIPDLDESSTTSTTLGL